MTKVAWLDHINSPRGKVLITIASKEGIEKYLVKPGKPFTTNDGRQFVLKGNDLMALEDKR